jgi:hypothetical protein
MVDAASTTSLPPPTTSRTASGSSDAYCSSPSLSPRSGATTDTGVTSYGDYEKGSLQNVHPSDHDDSPETSFLSPSRPGLFQRASSFYKRHSSFDTPREVPLPSGLTGFPFPPNPFETQEEDERAWETRGSGSEDTYRQTDRKRRPQLTSRHSTNSPGPYASIKDKEPLSAPLASLTHRPTQSGPPELQRSSSSSCSLPLKGLQSVHTLPQLEPHPLTETAHQAREDMYFSLRNPQVPPPRPSPPLPVRELSPPPSKRRGLLSRSKSHRVSLYFLTPARSYN